MCFFTERGGLLSGRGLVWVVRGEANQSSTAFWLKLKSTAVSAVHRTIDSL